MAPTTNISSSCCRFRLADRHAGIRAKTAISGCSEQLKQVVVSPRKSRLPHLLSSRLEPLPLTSEASPLSFTKRNSSKSTNPDKFSGILLTALSLLSILCFISLLPQAQTHTLPASTTRPQDSITTTTTQTTTTSLPASNETTTCLDCDQDERSSSNDDDDDAESCPGLSADATAKAKNLSDTQRLVNLQSCLQKKIKQKLQDSTRDSMELFDKLSLSGGCSASLMSLVGSLREIKSYAFKFFDASAKIPSGMMYGLLSDFGDFDQCLSIRSDPSVTLDMEPEERAFSGKYCLLDFHMNYHIKLAANESVPEGIQEDGILWDELVRHYWTSNSPKGFQIGMCFPSKCTNDDLDQIYRSVGESYNFKGRILQCQDGFDLRNEHTPDTVQRSILYVFYMFLVLTFIGTLVDRYAVVIEQVASSISVYGIVYEVFTCFSLSRSWTIFTSLSPLKQHNTCPMKSNSSSSSLETSSHYKTTPVDTEQEVHQAKYSSQTNYLSHLSGLRLFVILWITMGHSFLYPSASNYQHYRSIINMNLTRDSVWFATTNFTLGIDMLLYMAGMVFVYKFASTKLNLTNNRSTKSTSENTNKIWFLLAEKIFRFWPTYFAVIALAIIVPLLGDGPMWPEMVTKRIGGSCRKNWWTNLLFMNNFQKESEICLPSSWFVSVLMQLFLIGSIILVIEQKYSIKWAMVALGTILFTSCSYSFFYAFHFKVNAPVIRMDESFVMEMDQDIWHLYTNILNNLGPFLIGMLGGYLLLLQLNPSLKNNNNNSSSPIKLLHDTISGNNWIAEVVSGCVFGGIAALVLSSVFYQKYSPLGSSVYWSFHRVGWALFTGYLIHKCATGSWTLLKDLLSLSSFIPISRLIFVAYLVYPIFIHMHSGLVRDGLHVSIYNMFNVYITRLVLTFSTSLIIHLLFEIPLNLLEELIYKSFWGQRYASCSLPGEDSKQTTPAGILCDNKTRRHSSTTGVLLDANINNCELAMKPAINQLK